MIARGQLRDPRGLVRTAIDAVLQLLFWPVGVEEFAVPRGFADTTLGRLLVRATDRALAAGELVGIGEAARQLGVARPTVSRWIADGALDDVGDNWSGQTSLLHGDIDRRRALAAASG